MKVAAPPLAPILRSGSQGRILALLFAQPGRELTVTEIADLVGVAVPTALREIDRAEAAALVTTRRVGSARLVAANPAAPHFRALSEIVLAGFGPPAVIAEEFEHIDGVDALVLFGSWVARYAGVQGPPPNDVDVLVLGSPLRRSLYEAAERAERRLDVGVNVTVRSLQEWVSDDPFLRDVRSRPILPLAVNTDYVELRPLADHLGGAQ